MRQTQSRDEIGWFIGALPLAIGLAGIAYLLFQPSRQPALPNATVFGCYVAKQSPPILLDANGMHVRQSGYPVVPFHIENLKTGFALTADRPIRADRTAEGYRFGMDKRGIGWFMDFYRVGDDGQTYGVSEATELRGFQMLASDGAYLNYDPTDASRCD